MPLLLAVFLAFPAFADDTQVQAMVAPGQVSQGPSAGLSAAQGRVLTGRPGAAEKIGDGARARGNSAAAVFAYADALRLAAPLSEEDWRVRTKILDVAHTMGTPPSIPDQARRDLLAGMGLEQAAKDPSDYAQAAAELEKAVTVAPWWLAAYYQLGVVYEKAGKYGLAKRTLNLYLSGSPNPPEAKKARDRLYSLELRSEGFAKKGPAGKAKLQWITIPGGSFLMGSGNADEFPQHKVEITSFQLSRTLVTNRQYQLCVQAGACTAAAEFSEAFKGDDQPIVGVDWNQAKAFAEWAGGRLPSEAEYEYAARSAGEDWKYPWGNDDPNCSLAVVDGCRSAAAPVCSKPSGNSKQGLCDLAGNVWEWTQDSYHGSYNGAPDDGSAWENPPGSARVVRGGSWDLPGSVSRAASRGYNDPPVRKPFLGFRVARSTRPITRKP